MASFTSRGARLRLTNLATGATRTIDDVSAAHIGDHGTVRPGWPTFAEWQQRRAFTRTLRNATRRVATISVAFADIDAAAIAAAFNLDRYGDHQ